MRDHLSRLATPLFICLFIVLCVASGGVCQEDVSKYPSRPITFVIPVPPGGGVELADRLIARTAEKFLGQPITPINKPGGSMTIGIASVASSKPDGYTIGQTAHVGMFVLPITAKVPYHPVRDLHQIIQFGYLHVAVSVKGDSPFKSLKDVIDYARQNPNKLTYGSAGVGSLGYLVMEQIAKKEGVRFTHIPFKGAPETQTALLGGHILVATGDFNDPLLEAGQIRLLFLIAENRSTDYPETPVLRELGYDIPAPTFISIAGPKGIPEPIAKKLEDAFTKAMKEPSFIKGMKDLRLPIVYRNSREMNEYVANRYEVFEKVLKEMGLHQ